MIPAATEYVRARSIEEAVRVLRDKGPDARLLAGGHSLIPMMKLRMAAPQWLIDISAIAELQGVSVHGHELRLGATTTHAVIEHDPTVAKALPLLGEIARHIADPLVRNRGTIGGALSNADPSADWPAAALLFDAELDVVSANGSRVEGASNFFQGLYETSLASDELLTRVRLRIPEAGYGAAYEKIRHPASGYAVAGVAAMVRASGGRLLDCRIAVTGVASAPFRATRLEAALKNCRTDNAEISRAAELVTADVECLSDRYADAGYRAQLARTASIRAINRALLAMSNNPRSVSP
jgi:carbon-monoxide dehydrogenase medium subunit